LNAFADLTAVDAITAMGYTMRFSAHQHSVVD
jgi:hypothetical protein